MKSEQWANSEIGVGAQSWLWALVELKVWWLSWLGFDSHLSQLFQLLLKSRLYIYIYYIHIYYIYIYIYCIYYIYYILYIYYISYIYIKLKFQMSSARYHNWRSGLCTWKLLSKCKNIWRCSAPSFVYIEKGFKTRVVFRILPNIYRGALFRLKHITYND